MRCTGGAIFTPSSLAMRERRLAVRHTVENIPFSCFSREPGPLAQRVTYTFSACRRISRNTSSSCTVKALKGIHCHGVPSKIIVLFQAIPQPGEVIQWVEIAAGHQGIVSGKHRGNIPGLFFAALLPQRGRRPAARLRGKRRSFSIRQRIGAAAWIHLTAFGLGAEQLEGITHFLQSKAHEDGSATVVQTLACKARRTAGTRYWRGG